jgi:hypothetical protein
MPEELLTEDERDEVIQAIANELGRVTTNIHIDNLDRADETYAKEITESPYEYVVHIGETDPMRQEVRGVRTLVSYDENEDAWDVLIHSKGKWGN